MQNSSIKDTLRFRGNDQLAAVELSELVDIGGLSAPAMQDI